MHGQMTAGLCVLAYTFNGLGNPNKKIPAALTSPSDLQRSHSLVCIEVLSYSTRD